MGQQNPFDLLIDQVRLVVRDEIHRALKDEFANVLKDASMTQNRATQPEPEWMIAEDLARKFKLPKTLFEAKGRNPLTEHYSALGPEVLVDQEGEPLGTRNTALIERLLEYHAVLVAGQAKSHCVAWTVDDLIRDPTVRDRGVRPLRRGGRAHRALDRADVVLARAGRRGRGRRAGLTYSTRSRSGLG